jgi:hypothetical protein
VESKLAEPKGVSVASDRVVAFLREVLQFHKGKREFELVTRLWQPKYPDLQQLIEAAQASNCIEAFPVETWNAGIRQQNWHVTVTPRGLEIAKAEPREVSREVRIAGKRVDLRSERAHMILTPPIENLLPLAEIWMQRLDEERDPRAWRACRLTLDRLLAYRGHELPVQLRERIIEKLGKGAEVAVGEH